MVDLSLINSNQIMDIISDWDELLKPHNYQHLIEKPSLLSTEEDNVASQYHLNRF